MRHYKPMSQAQRDARTDARVARREAAGIPARETLLPRESAYVCVIVDGQTFIAEGLPGRRVDRFNWWLNGEPWRSGGLESLWREIQRRRAHMLGPRNLQ